MTRRPADSADYGVIAPHPITLPDGRLGAPGTVTALTAADAAPLVADGHLIPIEPTPAETKEN